MAELAEDQDFDFGPGVVEGVGVNTLALAEVALTCPTPEQAVMPGGIAVAPELAEPGEASAIETNIPILEPPTEAATQPLPEPPNISEVYARKNSRDLQLVLKARGGDGQAMDSLIKRYLGLVRTRANNYFLAGGENDDLIQEGLVGLYEAVRDFKPDKGAHFHGFAELCIVRQMITAVKTATRGKHGPLNTYVSFSHILTGQENDGDVTLGDALPGPAVHEPSTMVISTQELQSLVLCLGTRLSELESDALRMYLEGNSYKAMAAELSSDTKTIDNALQRVKRKIITHQKAREVLL